jgi:hypothetical protein
LYIKVPVPSKESERSCILHIYVRDIDIDLPLFLRFSYLILERIRRCGIFCVFFFYILCCHLMIVTCGNQHIVHGTFYASWISIFRSFYYFSDTMRYLKNRGTHVSVLLGSQIIIMFGQPSLESHKHDINTIAYEIYLPSQY